MLFQAVAAEADGLFAAKPPTPFSSENSKIDRSMPIVVETKQISDRRNFPSKSKAEISDGVGGGFDHRQEKFAAMNQRVIMD